MALPTTPELLTIDYDWRGSPFVFAGVAGLDTLGLDVDWRGSPFVAAVSSIISLQTRQYGPDAQRMNPLLRM
jgi:hypothetical protein